MKLFCLLMLLLAPAIHAAATTIVAVRTPREIVIGADSKVTDTFGNAFTHQACKIVQAGNVFFAYEGFSRDRKTGFSLPQIAGAALRLKPTVTAAEKVSILTGFITSQLFVELPQLKQYDPQTYREKIEGRTFIKILVAAFEGTSRCFSSGTFGSRRRTGSVSGSASRRTIASPIVRAKSSLDFSARRMLSTGCRKRRPASGATEWSQASAA